MGAAGLVPEDGLDAEEVEVVGEGFLDEAGFAGVGWRLEDEWVGSGGGGSGGWVGEVGACLCCGFGVLLDGVCLRLCLSGFGKV